MTETTAVLIERTIKQYTNAPCPDCGRNQATVVITNHYHSGIPDRSSVVTIDCEYCEYHEWYTNGPDE